MNVTLLFRLLKAYRPSMTRNQDGGQSPKSEGWAEPTYRRLDGQNPLAGAAGSSGRGGRTGGSRAVLVLEQRLGTGGDVQLLVNTVHVFADGIVANVQFPGDLLVAETFGQQGEGFLFALGEAAHLR